MLFFLTILSPFDWILGGGRGAVVACLATLNLIADELMSDLLH